MAPESHDVPVVCEIELLGIGVVIAITANALLVRQRRGAIIENNK